MEIEIISVKDLAPGNMTGIEKEGKSILVANINGNYYAIGNICTHMSCTLSDGVLKGEIVECPCHGSRFNLKTGSVVRGPALNPEPVYVLKLDAGKVLARL